jgi:plasmid stabilization system protein ParE
MRVRWTTDAADDLERICDYLAREHRRQRGGSLSTSCKRLRASARFQTVDALDASKVLANSC